MLREADPARQAALALHALSEQGRAQVMERMSEEHQSVLAPLLLELKQLGIPAQAGQSYLQAEPPADGAVF